MNQKRMLMKIVGARKAKEILEYLKEHGPTRYKELNRLISTGTLNERLGELSDSGLIQSEKRGLYEPTEKGKKVLQYLQGIEEDVLKLLTLRYIIEMLERIKEEKQMRGTDLMDYIHQPPYIKLSKLCSLGLVDHKIEKLEKRKEWFEITEKGKKVLQIVDDLVGVLLE